MNQLKEEATELKPNLHELIYVRHGERADLTSNDARQVIDAKLHNKIDSPLTFDGV